ncbi:MAG: Eco57I restriction-modification methylase domain-containing protein [Candidatus Woesearchaeota archaeon]
MKFDVILGNPPYNTSRREGRNNKVKSLYQDFVRLASTLSDNIWFVLPTRWMALPLYTKIREEFKNIGIKYVKIIDTKQRFFKDAIIEGGVCYVFFNKKYKGIPNYELTSGEIIKENFKNQIILINDLNIYKSILEKIKSKKNHFMNEIWFQNQEFKTNDKRINIEKGYKIRTAKGFKLIDIDENFVKNPKFNYNKYKTVFSYTTTNYMKGYGKIFIDNKFSLVNMSYAYFPFNTKREAVNCLKYLQTKFVITLKNATQTNINFTSKVFENIPAMDFKVEWNDEDLYEFFELSKEEINFIETGI